MQARKDMDPKFQWDFTHMYASDEVWETELNALVADLPKIAAIEGTLGASRESFKAGIDTVNEIARRLEKVYIYANLHRCADGSEPKHQEMDGKAMSAYVQFSTMVAFMEPEILSIPEETLNAFLAPDEIRTFVRAIAPTKYAVPALLALSSLRISEIEALRWEDIPTDPKLIQVRGAVVLDEKNKRVKKVAKQKES